MPPQNEPHILEGCGRPQLSPPNFTLRRSSGRNAVTSPSFDGVDALTPAHFFMQRPAKAYPEELIHSDPSLHRRWNMTKSIVNHFWKRWSAEYIQQLQRLKKWHKPSPNLKIGDLVIVKEDHTFTQQWPMARIIAVHPGTNGLVRTVTIKTETSKYKRPVVKLALLLSQDEVNATSSRSQDQAQEEDQEQEH